MTLIKFKKPVNSAINGYNRLNPVFDNFFNPLDSILNEFSPMLSHRPSANIKENDNEFIIELAAPGLKKEDFKIEVVERLLQISMEKVQSNESEHSNYLKQEFDYLGFTRSFQLPEMVDNKSIEASYEQGILKLKLPKKQEEVKNNLRIQVK